MSRIETVDATYRVAPTDLCLTSTGWRLGTSFEVEIGLEPGIGLEDAMSVVWDSHRGLLGEGDLRFMAIELEPRIRGYVVFRERVVESEG